MDTITSARPAVTQGRDFPGWSESATAKGSGKPSAPGQAAVVELSPSARDSVAAEQQASGTAPPHKPVDPSEPLQAKVQMDKDTGELVYQSIEATSDRVIYQTPDPAMLHMRAFLKEMEKRQNVQAEPEPKPGQIVTRTI